MASLSAVVEPFVAGLVQDAEPRRPAGQRPVSAGPAPRSAPPGPSQAAPLASQASGPPARVAPPNKVHHNIWSWLLWGPCHQCCYICQYQTRSCFARFACAVHKILKFTTWLCIFTSLVSGLVSLDTRRQGNACQTFSIPKQHDMRYPTL